MVEIVDETSTSEGRAAPDIAAAKSISKTRGARISKKLDIRPSMGEIRDIQRISRIESDGELTISRSLARQVARGDMDLEEAIKVQRGLDGDAGKRPSAKIADRD